MKKLILTAFVAAFGFVAVQAQDIPERKRDERVGQKMHDRKGGKHHRNEMSQLNLTEDQKAQFKKLNEAHRKQMADLKKQDNITVKESRDRMEALKKDHRTKIQGILTADQKAQLQKGREERKKDFQNRSAERKKRMEAKAGDRSMRMKKELNLTEQQSAALNKSRQEFSQKRKAIMENQSLNAEQKKEQQKELMKSRKEDMKKILTEEQLKKMEERKEKFKAEKKTK